ncbi:MAG: PilZ domain-containing protein [Nocardioides sp.]
MTTLPRVDRRVWLRTDDRRAYTSRVASVVDGGLLLDFPEDYLNEDSPQDLDLIWPFNNELYRMRARVSLAPQGLLATGLGEPEKAQRRAHMRIPMGTSMKLNVIEGLPQTSCILVDISEAGLRAEVPADLAPRMSVGAPAQAGFGVGGTGFMLTGTVHRIADQARAEAPGTRDVVVLFDIPENTQRALARAIEFEQMTLSHVL